MKRTLPRWLLAVIFLGSAASAQAQSELLANLSGASEVPPVVTGAFGRATFDLNNSGGVLGINYTIVVNNIRDAFMAHLHCAPAGQNGPIVVWLAGQAAAPAGSGFDLNGPWISSAKFKQANIIGGTPCGNTLNDLFVAMTQGRVYVNVHTVANGGGEIRGQVAPVAPVTVP